MPFTSFHLDKLRWLIRSTGFRRHPGRVMSRVFLWEVNRLLNREISYLYDQTFPITLRPNEGVSRLVFYFGVSEPDLFDFYHSYLRPGMTVLDVGANIGLHTLYMAKRVSPGGHVHAFEPSPEIFRRLLQHVQNSKLSNIHAHLFGLGAEGGETFFHQVESDTSRSFLSDKPSGQRVVVRTLDEVARENCWDKVHFVKMDVEGFELGVLRGARQFLSEGRAEVLQVEIDGASLARNSADQGGVMSFLTSLGYVHSQWDPQTKAFYRIKDGGVDYNSFFVSPKLMK